MSKKKQIISIRIKKIDRFLSRNNIDCLSFKEGEEASFSMRGCNICSSGGDNVYNCGGYNVCHECLCAYSNGYSDTEIKIDNDNFKYKK